MQYFPDKNIDIDALKQMASTGAGKQLLELFMKNSGSALVDSLGKSTEADYKKIKEEVASFLSTEQAQKLLKQLGGSNGR